MFFLARNSFLRLAFLLAVEGLVLFLLLLEPVTFPPLASREKEKLSPIVRENLKSLPWASSAWQRARHWIAREDPPYKTARSLVHSQQPFFAYF